MASTVTTAVGAGPMQTGRGSSITREVIRMDFTGQTLAKTETWTIRALPAGTVIHSAMIKVATAQADISDVDLGHHATGSTNASLIEAATLVATGYVQGVTSNMSGPIPILVDELLVFTNQDAGQSLTTGIIDIIIELSLPTWD